MERSEVLMKTETELFEARRFLRVWQQALFTETLQHPLMKLFHRIVQDLSMVLEEDMTSMRQTSAPLMMQ